MSKKLQPKVIKEALQETESIESTDSISKHARVQRHFREQLRSGDTDLVNSVHPYNVLLHQLQETSDKLALSITALGHKLTPVLTDIMKITGVEDGPSSSRSPLFEFNSDICPRTG